MQISKPDLIELNWILSQSWEIIEWKAAGWRNDSWSCWNYWINNKLIDTFNDILVSVECKRVTDDKWRPIEIKILSGFFWVSEKWKFYFYESEENFKNRELFEWIRENDWNTIKVELRGNKLIWFINGKSVGEFELKNPKITWTKVELMFKWDLDKDSIVQFKNIIVESLD